MLFLKLQRVVAEVEMTVIWEVAPELVLTTTLNKDQVVTQLEVEPILKEELKSIKPIFFTSNVTLDEPD